jgi:predicted nucleic acid-binding protein
MYTLDANIFIRDLDAREPDHAACHELIGQLVARAIPIVVPLIILAEVAGTVSRTRRDPIAGRLAADALRDIPTIRLLSLDEALAQEAAEIAADHALRGADAIYVAVARRAGSALISLDREQRERAASIVAALTPQQALEVLKGSS